MVDAQRVHTAELQAAGKGVPDDGRPQMPDMHLLGHIWRGKVHYRPLVFEGRCPRADALHSNRAVKCTTVCIEQRLSAA